MKALSFGFLFCLLGMAFGCKTSKPQESALSGANSAPAPTAEFANCRRPSLSPRGRRLLAICDHQKTHAHPQLYVIETATGENRRITWQDGEVTEALWIDEGRIAYASTTDEVKERLFREESPLPKDPPTEIYLSDLYGNEIIRLTDRPGFDGEMTLENTELSYVSVRAGKREVWRRNLATPKAAAAQVSLRNQSIHFPVALPQKRWLWLSTPEPTAEENFTLGWFAKSEPPTKEITRPIRLRRTSGGQGVLILERLEKGDRLHWLSADWKCLKAIWSEEARLSSADLVESPEPLLALGRVSPTGSRLQLVKLPPETLSCAVADDSPKMNP